MAKQSTLQRAEKHTREKGRKAYVAGVSAHDNPFNELQAGYGWWLLGWMDGQRNDNPVL